MAGTSYPKGAEVQFHVLFEQETVGGSLLSAQDIGVCLDVGIKAGLQEDAASGSSNPLMLVG